MKPFDVASFFASHVVAASVYGLTFLAVPGLLAGVLLVVVLVGCFITGDAGGPMFFPIVLTAGGLYAVCMAGLAVLFFILTSGLHFLRQALHYSWWVPVVLALPVVLAIFLPTRIGGPFLSVLVASAFCLYWLAFIGSDRVLQWTRKKFKEKKITTS